MNDRNLQYNFAGYFIAIHGYFKVLSCFIFSNPCCFGFRLETTQRSLDVAEKENNSLNELNTMLRKQGDNLKSKQEGYELQANDSFTSFYLD